MFNIRYSAADEGAVAKYLQRKFVPRDYFFSFIHNNIVLLKIKKFLSNDDDDDDESNFIMKNYYLRCRRTNMCLSICNTHKYVELSSHLGRTSTHNNHI